MLQVQEGKGGHNRICKLRSREGRFGSLVPVYMMERTDSCAIGGVSKVRLKHVQVQGQKCQSLNTIFSDPTFWAKG